MLRDGRRVTCLPMQIRVPGFRKEFVQTKQGGPLLCVYLLGDFNRAAAAHSSRTPPVDSGESTESTTFVFEAGLQDSAVILANVHSALKDRLGQGVAKGRYRMLAYDRRGIGESEDGGEANIAGATTSTVPYHTTPPYYGGVYRCFLACV